METFTKEYCSNEAVLRYTARTAGYGIGYLLEHDYARVYVEALENYVQLPENTGLRLLEFGCGGGMNIIKLIEILARQERRVDVAYGTDFSEPLIKAACAESRACLPVEDQGKLSFFVARNEELVNDLAKALCVQKDDLLGSFHLILGVNTFRYCHRLGKAKESAQGIFDLLAPGGLCIMIEMNSRYPLFRSRIRDLTTMSKEERYLPSLEEYTLAFKDVGFQIVQKGTFCWIPHSAGQLLTNICRSLAPVLNAIALPFAMRCLVVSRKPLNAS